MPDALTINTTDYALRRSREQLLGGLFGALDSKRPAAWDQYGYPKEVTFAQLRSAYERGGAGHGAVHRILDKCWQECPRIKREEPDDTEAPDKPTAWEKKLEKMLKGVRAWAKFRDFDRRNMVGHYAALIYRVADGKKLSEPLQKASALVDLVPVFEDQIKVTEWHSDEADADNFGKPRMFQYRTRDLTRPSSDTQAQPEAWREVHPSRVQILAEGSVGDMFDGVPLLLAGFNHLVDLEKIAGGSAESFLKNSARSLVIKFDAQSNPQQLTQNADGSDSGKPLHEVIQDRADSLNRNIDAAMAVQGGEITTLQTHQIDPQPPFEVAANLFAASVRIPFTILFGQQTGRLASDEDKADMVARCRSRQETELTPAIEEFIRRMQACGVVEAGEFEVEWPPIDAPGDEAKYALMAKLAAAAKDAQAAGITEPLVDANELRAVGGFPERANDGMPPEGADPGVDPGLDPAGAGQMGK